MLKETGFSIIVPTYNTYESYLRECLDSLTSIKYTNFEVLIIDDGSNDTTKKILEEYNHFDYLKIIHQENKGISASRFTGINSSKYGYIMFVDSDDIINSEALNVLNDIVIKHNPDFILHSSPRFKDKIDDMKEDNHLFKEGLVDKQDMIKEILSLHMNGIGNVVAKKSIYKDIDKHIDFSIINGEDLQQTSYIALNSNSFYYTEFPLDYYRFNEKDRTYYDVTKINEVNFLVPTYKQFFEKQNKYNDLLDIFLIAAKKAILYIAFQICLLKIERKDKYKYLDELNKQEIVSIVKKSTNNSLVDFVFNKFIDKKYLFISLVSILFSIIF